MQPFSYDDLCWLAQLFSGFFGLLRLGELVWSDSGTGYSHLSSRSSVSIGDSFFSFIVPSRKSDLFHEGDTIRITWSVLPDDPYSLFAQYLAFRDVSFPLHPLLWVHADGLVPTRVWFLTCFHAIFPDPSLGGHSLRSGGATSC